MRGGPEMCGIDAHWGALGLADWRVPVCQRACGACPFGFTLIQFGTLVPPCPRAQNFEAKFPGNVNIS